MAGNDVVVFHTTEAMNWDLSALTRIFDCILGFREYFRPLGKSISSVFFSLSKALSKAFS
jgi:hypothetical protein